MEKAGTSHPHRVALSGFLLLLWGAMAGMIWMMWPGADTSLVWHMPAVSGAQQTRLGRAIKTSMGPHIPKRQEREMIWQWIASHQSRDRFYADVWPLLKKRCHTCHGSLHRPKGAMALTRLAHVLPLVRVKASARRQLWRTFSQQLPLAGGLLLLLALLWSREREGGPSVGWSALAFAGLACHGLGVWWRVSQPVGTTVAASGLVIFGVAVLRLGIGFLQTWWKKEES